MPVRPRFDPKRALIVARPFRFAGREYSVGDQFPHPDDPAVAPRLLARQYEARAVNMSEDTEADEPVQMKPGPKNGRWTITAPWMDEPLVIRGKKRAEEALADLRSEGAPLGWIEGGSAVEIDDLDGGWFEITAPWLDEPEKLQGQAEAEARQREIHDAGEPETYKLVTLSEGEGSWWQVKPAWLAEPENVQGEEKARERAAELRAEGPPEGWEPESGLAVDPEQAGDGAQGDDDGKDGDQGDDGASEAQDDAQTAQTDDEGGDQTDQAPDIDADALVTAKHAGGGMFDITAPWLETAERTKGKVAAEKRRTEIVKAGPPEGWTPASD